MIPRAYITEWRQYAPWTEDAQVEQDLIIERALQEIYSNPFLKSRLAFRGGTALHKLHLAPAARYSEDIDLVQLEDEPIGPYFEELRNALAFLGDFTYKQKSRNNTLFFKYESEIPPATPMKVKVEINCRERKPVLGNVMEIRSLQSQFFTGEAPILTYPPVELLGTKIRALYQRKKGRDLFDLWLSEDRISPDWEKVVEIFQIYLESDKIRISKKEFEQNIRNKLTDRGFREDTRTLLRDGIEYDIDIAADFVLSEIGGKL